MLIIFGFRTRPSKVSEGQFFCPRDGGNRPYVHSRYRQWFTLFFIPIFPMGKYTGEVVKCQACGTVYRPDVLGGRVATTAVSYSVPGQPQYPASPGSTAPPSPAPAAEQWSYPAPPASAAPQWQYAAPPASAPAPAPQPQWPAQWAAQSQPLGNPGQQATNPPA